MLTDKQSIILCLAVTLLFVVSGIFGILENFAIIGLLSFGLLMILLNIAWVHLKDDQEDKS